MGQFAGRPDDDRVPADRDSTWSELELHIRRRHDLRQLRDAHDVVFYADAARIAAEAKPCEVLVSSIVRDLAAGSGIDFEDRGTKTLKGVPGEWQLYAVDASSEIDRERPALVGD